MLRSFIYVQWYLELKVSGVKKTTEKDSVLCVMTDFLIKTIIKTLKPAKDPSYSSWRLFNGYSTNATRGKPVL